MIDPVREGLKVVDAVELTVVDGVLSPVLDTVGDCEDEAPGDSVLVGVMSLLRVIDADIVDEMVGVTVAVTVGEGVDELDTLVDCDGV